MSTSIVKYIELRLGFGLLTHHRGAYFICTIWYLTRGCNCIGAVTYISDMGKRSSSGTGRVESQPDRRTELSPYAVEGQTGQIEGYIAKQSLRMEGNLAASIMKRVHGEPKRHHSSG